LGSLASLGFFSAWLVVKIFPAAARSGRWVWLPLAAILALLIWWDVLGGWDWHLISNHYFWEYPAQKLGPIQRDILTYPALSAIAYSLGVVTRAVQCRKVLGV
jgi:type VI protein secretion system component VasK